MGLLTETNACYGGDFGITEDLIGGGLGGTYLTPGQCGGGKKRKQMRTKKRGSSKRVSTLRKKRGSSKRKNRGSFKRRKHSKREVVQSIMKGLGEKRIKRGGEYAWRTRWRESRQQKKQDKEKRKEAMKKLREKQAFYHQHARDPSKIHNVKQRRSLFSRIFRSNDDEENTQFERVVGPGLGNVQTHDMGESPFNPYFGR